MDAKGRLWFPWLHFLSYLGWLEGWWVPFLRGGESRGMDKGERVWIREALGRGSGQGLIPQEREKDTGPGENAGTAAAGGEQECRIPPASGTAMQELP